MSQANQFGRWALLVSLAALLSFALAATAQEQEAESSDESAASEPTTDAEWIAYFQRVYEEGQEAETIEDYTLVIETCEKGLEEPDKLPKDYPAYARRLLAWTLNKRGELYDQQDQVKEGLTDFRRSVGLDPRNWRAIHNRGVSLARVGEYENAISDFDQTIELKRNYPNAYFNRGELRYGLGRYEEAVEDYNQAIRLSPRDSAAYNSRGHAYYRMANYRAAIDDFGEAIELDEQNAAAHTNRGDAYADLGYYSEAANDYRAAIDLDSNLGRAYQSAAWLMATCPDDRFRDTTRAIAAAQRAISLDGEDDYRYLDTQAAALANAGQFDRAQEIQARAIELAPKDVAERYRERLALYEQEMPYRTNIDIPRERARRDLSDGR